MCLLVVLAQTHPGLPLVVGANRDELLDRPAVPMTVLQESNPRILGGRDELAGGTWLAVNEAGVVAGLTNRPMGGERDLAKRSRGELPLALAAHTSAAAAVEAFAADRDPAQYNPSWLLVGDRTDLFLVDMTGTAALVRPLTPGVHILENSAFDTPSPKVDHVRSLLEGVEDLPEDALVQRLQVALGDHVVPAGLIGDGGEIPPEVKAACVHTERYGTRWSAVVTVPAADGTPPALRYADGPACAATYADAAHLWSAQPV